MGIFARMKKFNSLNYELTPAQLTLLTVQGVFLLASGFSSVFINLFIFSYNESIQRVVLYYIPHFAFTFLSFYACSFFCKKYGVVVSLKTGIFCYAASYALLLLFGEFFAYHPWYLGILLGVSAGFYYLAYNVMYFEYSQKNWDTFLSAQGVVNSISSLIAPLSAGAIIGALSGKQGYVTVFSISLLLFLSAFLISLNLPKSQNGERTYFRSMFLLFIKNRAYLRGMSSELFRGFREGAMMFLPPVLIYKSLKSEFLIGTYSFTSSLFSILAYFILGRFIDASKRKRYLLFGGVCMFLVSLIPLINNAAAPIFIYGVLVSFFVPFVMNGYTPIMYETLNQLPNIQRRRIESMAVRETFINVGRLIGIIPILFMTTDFQMDILLILLGLSQIGIYLLLKDN